MRALWRVLAHRDFRLLLSAGLISLTGDWILRIGLAYYTYRITGSTLASGVVVLASTLPQLLLGTVAGTFVDRWSRRGTMIVANLLLAVGLLPLLLVHHAGQIWIVYLVTVFAACVEQFFAPAEAAILPSLVDEENLVSANALNGQNRDVARLVGAALGGVAAGVGGLTAVTVLDVGSFLLAAALLGLIRARGAAAVTTPEPDPVPALRGWVDGLRTAVRNRTVRAVLLYLGITSVGEGVMSTLMAPWVSDVLHGDGRAYGTILSVQAAGGIAGGLVAAGLGNRIRPELMFGVGAVLFGALDLVLFLYPLVLVAVWPAGVVIALVGLPGACLVAGCTTLLQTSTEDSHRGRVFGALGSVMGLGALLGTVGAGLLGDRLGIVPVIATQGAGNVVGGVLVLILLRARAPIPATVPEPAARPA
ncbi:MAG: MFS transporter [Actinocatenispora sp.]